MFPIDLNTFHGIRSVDPELVEMGKVYGLNSWQLFRRIILPGALSSIRVGVRFSLGIMWLTLIVAETIAADSGIGYVAMNAREFMQTDIVVLAIVIYALFGKLADIIAKTLEKYWLSGIQAILKHKANEFGLCSSGLYELAFTQWKNCQYRLGINKFHTNSISHGD